MKRILPALLFALIVMTSFAQTKSDSSKHLAFKGVPIDGTLNEYVLKMKQNGFAQIKTGDGVALLKGDFASYKDCVVEVSTLKQRNLVSKIAVQFPDCDTWSSLSSNYFNLKELLTEKYGEPSDNEEKFQSYGEPRDDGSKFFAVKTDGCKYSTTYRTEKGTIKLSIEHQDFGHCFVKLAYSDKINSDTLKKGALDDL